MSCFLQEWCYIFERCVTIYPGFCSGKVIYTFISASLAKPEVETDWGFYAEVTLNMIEAIESSVESFVFYQLPSLRDTRLNVI